MAQLSVSVDLAGVLGSVPALINEQVFPHLAQAVRALADNTAYRWKDAVMKASIWDGEKQAYAASIQWESTGPFTAEVWTDYEPAAAIEDGRPPRDLKRMLLTSKKVRATKGGKRYLIIPLRHNTPGNTAHAQAMPPDVYQTVSAKNFQKSKVSGKTTRLSASGHTVPQNLYAWGARLKHLDPGTGRPSRYHGMYRFNTTAAGKKGSAYLTFRTMREGSAGWIIAARPGLQLASQVAQTMQSKAETVFGKAMELDTAPS